jgi:hypothetical protein
VSLSFGAPGRWQIHRVAGIQNPEALAFTCGRDDGLEAMRRIAQPTRFAAAKADRAVGAPVDRQHQPGLDQLGRPHRRLRIEVSLPDRSPPPSDREQGDVDVPE